MNGNHLILSSPARTALRSEILAFLFDCPDQIGMTRITEPDVHEVGPGHIAGFVVIAESHISVHCEKGWTFVDVFSCRPFDSEVVLALCHMVLGMGEIESELVLRGDENRAAE